MTEIEALREEIAALRREIADLRADRVVHHYHHQASPAPYVQPPSLLPRPPLPPYPGAPYPVTCVTGKATGLGAGAWNGVVQ